MLASENKYNFIVNTNVNEFFTNLGQFMCKHCKQQKCKELPNPKNYCITANLFISKILHSDEFLRNAFPGVKPWKKVKFH